MVLQISIQNRTRVGLIDTLPAGRGDTLAQAGCTALKSAFTAQCALDGLYFGCGLMKWPRLLPG